MGKVKAVHQMTVGQWEKAFPNEDACRTYLAANRWPQGVKCPRCGADVAHSVATMPHKWQCYSCTPDSGYRFSVLVGTVFENTNVPLRTWFRVIHMMLTSKKGVSALEVHRVIGTGSYRTAWYMCHRIRAGLQDKNFRQLVGIVEVDETFIGGKGRNKHHPSGTKNKRGPSGKTPIVGAVERKGNVVARVIAKCDHETLQKFVREMVSDKVSLLATDENTKYNGLTEYPSASAKGISVNSDGEITAYVEVKNAGQTPAFDVQIPSGIVIRPAKDRFDVHTLQINDEQFSELGSITLPKDGTLVIAPRRPIAYGELIQAAAQDERFYVFGLITWEDIFGQENWTEFCMFLDLKLFLQAHAAGTESQGEKVSISFKVSEFCNDSSLRPAHREVIRRLRTENC